jgi:plasmid stability protein
MKAIHIRNVPDEALAALKRRAARNHRSLQMELRAILCAVAAEVPRPAPLPELELKMSTAPDRGRFRRKDIYGDKGR